MNKRNTISVRLSDKELTKLDDLAAKYGGRTNAIRNLLSYKPLQNDIIEALELSDTQKHLIEEVKAARGCNTYYVIRRFMSMGINQYLISEDTK